MKRLIEIQKKLKAPKNQYNNFGKYKYRSCEDILEGVKPLLSEVGLALVIADEIVQLDNRFYVKATATLFDEEGKQITSTSAFAREEENKKKMDGAQVTGATSSYARKYALNGLFAIDDAKDADTDEVKNIERNAPKEGKTPSTTSNTDDTTIIQGLYNFDTIEDLVAYKDKYKDKVSDVKKFKEMYTKCHNRLNGKENNE